MEEINDWIGLLQAKYGEAQEIEERVSLINQQINELEEFNRGLEELKKSKEDKILASLGKGVFLPASLTEKQLYLGVGAGIYVKKSLDETKEVVLGQVRKLIEMKGDLMERDNILGNEMQELIKKIEKKE